MWKGLQNLTVQKPEDSWISETRFLTRLVCCTDVQLFKIKLGYFVREDVRESNEVRLYLFIVFRLWHLASLLPMSVCNIVLRND